MTLTPHDIIDLSEDGKLTKRIIKAADASAKKPQKGAECVGKLEMMMMMV